MDFNVILMWVIFNIHLQVTNKGIVPPLGLSPAIWKLEGKKHFAPYSEVLYLIRVDAVESEPWEMTSLVTLIAV